MEKKLTCPLCGGAFPVYANPSPTADVVIYDPEKGVVIIARKNEPKGFALPGGFVDEGEYVESAARREMLEETGLDIILDGVLGVYSRPDRDPRSHTLTTVFVGHPVDAGALTAGDDAGSASWYQPDALPSPLCFDHETILLDFREYLEGKHPLAPVSRDWLQTPEGRTRGTKA